MGIRCILKAISRNATYPVVLDKLAGNLLGVAENEERLVESAHPPRAHDILPAALLLLCALADPAIRLEASKRLLDLEDDIDELGAPDGNLRAPPAELYRLPLGLLALLLELLHELRVPIHELLLLLRRRLLRQLADSSTGIELELVRAETEHGLHLINHLVGQRLSMSRLGRLGELAEQRMGDGERDQALAMLGLLKGEGTFHDEVVGGCLALLRLGQARGECRGEGGELGCVQDGAGESLVHVVLDRGGGGGTREASLEQLRVSPCSLGVEQKDLQVSAKARGEGQLCRVHCRWTVAGTHLSLVTFSAVTSFLVYFLVLLVTCERPADLRRWWTLPAQ